MKKSLLSLFFLCQVSVVFSSVQDEFPVMTCADLSPASFHPSQLLSLVPFLEDAAKQTNVPEYREDFQGTAHILLTTSEALQVFYKSLSTKAQGKGRQGKGEKFYLPRIGERERFEQLTSGTLARLYQSLCLVIPDMAERLFGRATGNETVPLFLKHQGHFDTYGRFCNFYVDALKQMYGDSFLAKGASHGLLPGHKKYPLLYVKDRDDYLLSSCQAAISQDGMGFSYFAPTVTRPYTSSGLLYDAQGHVTPGWGLLLTHVSGYNELVDVGFGPQSHLLEWHVQLYAPDFTLSPCVKMFETSYFTTPYKEYRTTVSDTPKMDEFMIDKLFAKGVEAYLAKGVKEYMDVVEYIPLPTTREEQCMWRLLTLEEERQAILALQSGAVMEGQEQALLPYAQELAEVTQEIEILERAMVEDEIRAEQQAISTRVVREASASQMSTTHQKKAVKKRGAHQGKRTQHRKPVATSSRDVAPSFVPTEQEIAVARARVEDLKLGARVKWKALLGHVGQLISEGLVKAKEVRVSGSHAVIHTGSGAPVTLVRPHGGRDAVWRSAAQDSLMELILSSQKGATLK